MGFLNVLLVIVLVLSGIATVLLVLMHSGKGTGLSEMISASVMPSGAGTGIVEKNLPPHRDHRGGLRRMYLHPRPHVPGGDYRISL